MGPGPHFPVIWMVLVWMVLAAAALVEPPTNVTLHCRSLTNTLMWDYGSVPPGLKYRINIGVYYEPEPNFPNVVWVEPPARKVDLSFLSNPSEGYNLMVTAVVGDDESAPAPSEDGITFSYYKEVVDVNHICFVDLPSVDVTAQPHNKLLVRFQHPWLQFQQKLLDNRKPKTRKKKSHDGLTSELLPVFDYEVTIVNKSSHTFSCDQMVCEDLVPVDPAEDRHCLQISGDLEQMLVKGNDKYCAQSFKAAPTSSLPIYVSILISVVAAALMIIVSMVCYKKTKPSSQFSSVGATNFERMPQSPRTMEPVEEVITVMEVDSSSAKVLLSSMESEESLDPFPAVCEEPDLRAPLGVPRDADDDADVDVVDVPQVSEDAAAYRSRTSLDEDEDKAPSEYEKRAVPVLLGPNADDLADGYRGSTKREELLSF